MENKEKEFAIGVSGNVMSAIKVKNFHNRVLAKIGDIIIDKLNLGILFNLKWNKR